MKTSAAKRRTQKAEVKKKKRTRSYSNYARVTYLFLTPNVLQSVRERERERESFSKSHTERRNELGYI